MALRTVLAIGLLASGAIASPGVKTITKTVTKMITESASCSSSTIATTAVPTKTNPTTTLLATETAKNYGLHEAAKATGKLWFGTAADLPGSENDDEYYMKEFNNVKDFGCATPANAMKFEQTEPGQNQFNFTQAEQFLAAAEATNKLIRCHNLIWMSELPTWVTNPTTNWTNATLSTVLVNHVQTLVRHFGDRCYSWDVVNEALADDPPGAYQDNIWHTYIGPEYVPLAFKSAMEVVKEKRLKVKLFYNDYNIEYPGPKSTAAQNIVKELQHRGIQIDGVGLESHFTAGETPSKAVQEKNMRAFASMGIDIAVTELDVRMSLPPNATSEAWQVQDYYNTVAACACVDRCIGITVWDFDDTYSWVPSSFPGLGYADIFLQPKGANTPLVKKAPYDGCLQALTGEAESS